MFLESKAKRTLQLSVLLIRGSCLPLSGGQQPLKGWGTRVRGENINKAQKFAV